MNSITITLPDRAYDGLVEAGNRNGLTAESIAAELLTNQGNSYAELFRLGVITSAAFMARLTPAEYSAIRTAAETNQEVADLITLLTSVPHVSFSNPRVEPGLALLVAEELLAPERTAELLAYDRPAPAGLGE